VGRSSFSFEQGSNLRDQWRDGTMLTKVQGWVAAYPQFVNPTPAVLADVRFRRALLHALDRQGMADALQLGLVGVAHSIVGPNEALYPQIESSIVKYDYDQRRAAQLIESLGYVRGANGMFHDAAGQELAVELRTTAELDIHLTTVYPMADAWRQVGVAAEPVVIPPQRQTDKEFMNIFPAFHMIGSGNSLTTAGVGRYYSSKVPLPENNFQAAGNYSRYQSAELDGLLDRYFSAVPMSDRAPALARVINHMTDQLVQMGLFYNGAAVMVSNRLQNVQTGYALSTGAWNSHEWDVKQ
jgi:peptide/nickel transport system substrate-binding protein